MKRFLIKMVSITSVEEINIGFQAILLRIKNSRIWIFLTASRELKLKENNNYELIESQSSKYVGDINILFILLEWDHDCNTYLFLIFTELKRKILHWFNFQ